MRPNYEKICRICGNYHTELMPIFKNEGVEHDLPKKIKQHFYSVTITELDGLPTQICYQCVSALVSWHDLFELCEEVNKKFRCDVSEKENDSTKNELKISNILADSDNDHPEQSEQDDISNANKTEDKDLIFDLKLEDSNVMLVSMDNVKLDNEFFFKMSPTQNELSKMENDIYEPPGDSMDMEYSDDGGDSREDDLLSLDGNPPSIVLDDFGDRVNDYEGEACSSNGGTKKNDPFSQSELVRKKGRQAMRLPPVCHICKKVFSCTLTKRIHLRTIHSNERPYLCDFCSRNFKRKDHLTNHIKFVHEGMTWKTKYSKNSFLCSQCGRIFANKTSYKDHVNSVHNKLMLYKCEQCDLSFSRYSSFYHHRTVMKHRTQGQKQPYFGICEHCGLEFESEYYHRRHVWKHEEHLNCEMCAIEFTDRGSFLTHIQEIHTQEKQLACETCGKMFGNKVGLYAHRRVHNTEDRPYQCATCSWRFLKKGQLRAHMYRHTGECPYTCPVCGRTFKQKGDLRYHKATHVRFKIESEHHALEENSENVVLP